MMSDWQAQSLPVATQDFRRARARARLERILARLKGESSELLCYEDVHATLKLTSRTSRGLQDIPLDAIVGSVGDCSDFTRTFLPLHDQHESKWARVELATTELKGVPPIEVYRIDQVYFVLDGNHRVSVARQLGATHIQAYVAEFHTRVPLSPDTKPDLIVKAEYASFLERTNIDRHRPEANLSVSVPGQYPELEEHIEVHRCFMGLDSEREIPFEEAVSIGTTPSICQWCKSSVTGACLKTFLTGPRLISICGLRSTRLCLNESTGRSLGRKKQPVIWRGGSGGI